MVHGRLQIEQPLSVYELEPDIEIDATEIIK
jgi:hypothetical protein